MSELYHHGVLGQKWGVRRYQNYDGSLTAKGAKRYKVDSKNSKAAENWTNNQYVDYEKRKYAKHSSEDSSSIHTNWIKQSQDELAHWGVLGMKWGHRRYQNTDGSLTELGEIHYGKGSNKERRKAERTYIKTKESEDKAFVKTAKKIASYEDKVKRDAKKQEEEDLRLKRKREKKIGTEIEKEERAAKKKAEAEKKAEDKETRDKLEAEKKAKEKEEKQEQKAEQKQAKQEAKEAKKKEAEEAKREEQIKKDTEKVREVMKEQSQNETPKPERKPISSKDYQDVSLALKSTSDNLYSMKNLVDVVEGARQRNAVRNAVGERKLTKPISEMTNQEINDTISRWTAEDRIAQLSVGARSKAADNVSTTLDVVGNLTLQTGRAFSIAQNVRSIVERR